MRLVFFGSGEFALPILEHLCKTQNVVLVVTRPDSARGRGKQVKRSLVAQFCDDNNISVLQPETVNSPGALEAIKACDCIIAVLASYSEILSQEVTAVFEKGIVNVHPSLLPEYRGAEPIRWPIRRGDAVTGSTLMLISSGLDRGNILWQQEIPIAGDDTYGTMTVKLTELTCNNIDGILTKVMDGYIGIEQSQEKTFYARKLKPSDEMIDFNADASVVSRHIRSLDPVPGGYCLFQGKRIKLFNPKQSGESGKPGQVLNTTKKLVVACASGSLEIGSLQPENSKKMDSKSFLASGKVNVGDYFVSVDLNDSKK
jgi:methionyl-tRNA formyltransferase